MGWQTRLKKFKKRKMKGCNERTAKRTFSESEKTGGAAEEEEWGGTGFAMAPGKISLQKRYQGGTKKEGRSNHN